MAERLDRECVTFPKIYGKVTAIQAVSNLPEPVGALPVRLYGDSD